MNIVFHVGFPKAASTTFQKGLFSKHSEIVNLGIYPTGNIGKDSREDIPVDMPFFKDLRIKKMYQSLTKEDGVNFDDDAAKKLFSSLIEDYGNNNSTIVFSNESILSARFSNPEIIEKARRIQIICPQAKILIIIRSQVDMLKALYRDHPFDPRTLDISPRAVSFTDWLKIQIETPYLSLINTLLFHKVLKKYEQLFPKDNILIVPLELLKVNPEIFVKSLSDFLEINPIEVFLAFKAKHENQGISDLGNQYRRWRSRLLPYMRIFKPARKIVTSIDKSLFDSLKFLGSTERVSLSEEDLMILHKKYSDDNNCLAENRNLPLMELGYLISNAKP